MDRQMGKISIGHRLGIAARTGGQSGLLCHIHTLIPQPPRNLKYGTLSYYYRMF